MKQAAEPTAARAEIYEIFADQSADLDEQVDRMLKVGSEYLGVPIGFLTEIDDGTQTVVASTGPHDLIQPGSACPLEDAYCQRTLEHEGALSIQNVADSEAVPARAVETFGLSTYIGAKVVVDGEAFGTVCFADERARPAAFSEAEELFVELVARLTGHALERREYERELESRNESLAAEKRRFRGIADASFDILFRVDLDGDFTYVSPAVERVLGYEPADLEGEAFVSFLADSAVEPATEVYQRALDGAMVEGVQLEFETVDGESALIEINARPVTGDDADAGAEPVAVQGVGRDVTERVERQAELRRKNRAIDEADLGITIADATDPDLPVTYANEAFRRITGYPESEILGRNCRFLQGEATDQAAIDTIREGLTAQEPMSMVVCNYRRDGTPFWNHLTVTPVEDEAGEVTDFVGFQQDVTERKRKEKLLDVLNRVLRHNLRNDMSAILGYSELLVDGEDGDDGGTTHAERIHDVATKLTDLSEKAHRLETVARCQREPRRIDLPSLLPAVVDEYREAAPAAEFSVDLRTDHGVCAGTEFETAVVELIENALEHADRDDPQIRITARRDGDWVELDVADDGPGIGESEAAVATAGEESPLAHGSGLGLWLVNWIVTRYGGSFEIGALDDDAGTLATLRLPAIGPDDAVADVARRPTTLFW